jgi:hypothetical protein
LGAGTHWATATSAISDQHTAKGQVSKAIEACRQADRSLVHVFTLGPRSASVMAWLAAGGRPAASSAIDSRAAVLLIMGSPVHDGYDDG